VLLADPRYVTWCEQCNWNLNPERKEEEQSFFNRFYDSMGQRLSRGLFEELERSKVPRPRLTISKALAFLMAALVHSVTFVLLVGGLLLTVRGWPRFVIVTEGVICLILGIGLIPRMGRKPKKVASRQEFPVLFSIVDRIRKTLNAREVDYIVIDKEFNASFGNIGWFRRRVLTIGLPLFSILTPEERIGILAHELAHGVNRDPARSFFVGAAINSSWQWYRYLHRGRITVAGGTLADTATAVVEIVLNLLSIVPKYVAYILTHLLWRDSQRAEYLADYLATRVSGTDAMLSGLNKLHHDGAFRHVVQKLALGNEEKGVVQKLRTLCNEMPKREMERLRRLNALETTRLDATHPPILFRTEFLNSHRVEKAQVVLSDAEAKELENELLKLQPQIEEELVDDYRRRMYY
jgi:Zn-dependent protease with chaperone function